MALCTLMMNYDTSTDTDTRTDKISIPLQQVSLDDNRSSRDPNIAEEDADGSVSLPAELEIHAIAMCQWQMQQDREADALFSQQITPERVEQDRPSTIALSNLSTAQQAWQSIQSGHGDSRTPRPPLVITLENQCWLGRWVQWQSKLPAIISVTMSRTWTAFGWINEAVNLTLCAMCRKKRKLTFCLFGT